MEIGELRSGDSEIPAEFPALTRAKQRFLERKATASGVPRGDTTPRSSPRTHLRASGAHAQTATQDVGSPSTTTWTQVPNRAAIASTSEPPLLELMLTFCADLDEDLHALSNEVHVTDSSIRQAHQQVCESLDALTTKFVSGNPAESLAEELSAVAPIGSQAVCEGNEEPMSQRLDRSVKCDKTKKIAVITRQTLEDQQTPQLHQHNKRCRVALLALQAVHAHVIQHHYRRFLYHRLSQSAKELQGAICED